MNKGFARSARRSKPKPDIDISKLPPDVQKEIMDDGYPAYIQHPEDPGKKIYIPEEEQNEFWSKIIEYYEKPEQSLLDKFSNYVRGGLSSEMGQNTGMSFGGGKKRRKNKSSKRKSSKRRKSKRRTKKNKRK